VVPSTFHRFLGGAAPRHAGALDTGVAVVLLVAYALYLIFMLGTHPEVFAAKKGEPSESGTAWSVGRATGTLVAASLGAAWMSEVLVGAAEATGHALGMSPLFIGIVLLAAIGGAAEKENGLDYEGTFNQPYRWDAAISLGRTLLGGPLSVSGRPRRIPQRRSPSLATRGPAR
jgi:calcium/proton exchanger cax